MIYKNNDNYYSCYSPKLHDFLGDFDIEPIDEFTNIKTQKKCWVYQKDERLSIFLTQWTNNKKQGGEQKGNSCPLIQRENEKRYKFC